MRLIAVGRLRDGPEAVLFARYNARLRPPITVTEIQEGHGAPAEAKRREATAMLAALPPAAFAVALGTFTVLLAAIALNVHDAPAVTTLVILCGAPLGVLNTLFTETAMNISPVPRPVASAGYNFVRFLGGAISPYICGKLGENVSLAAPFYFGAACVAAGLIVLTTVGAKYLKQLNASH